VVLDSGCTGINGGACSGSDGDCTDLDGHGTAVASNVADSEFGVAPNARVSCFRYSGLWGVLQGISWAIEQEADVVNMSFSFKPSAFSEAALEQITKLLNPAVEEMANESGIYAVVGIGNQGADACLESPSSASGARVIKVQAHDQNGNIATFSNFGTCTDLSAPGVDIPVRALSGGSRTDSGCSFSAPHVSGSIARLLSDGREVSKNILTSLGTSITDLGGFNVNTHATGC